MSRSVGEFTLVGHLGEGSFATVFLARQRDTGREFAMKAISRARMQGKLQENLESEISILKSFRHINIVELYDIKKTERHIYLVLEYCAGGDLRALIRKEGRLTEPAVRHFMRHLGSGLHFLWCKNLVHRDLKPQNLLLTGPGLDATLKIADFGFARHLAQASMAETICGSPLYMAPEILQGHKYGAKADLWSVGAILFEMLAGKPPFGGANQIQLLANIRRAPTPAPRDGYYPMPDGVPRPGRACAELLCRLLVPDPQHRASFREFFSSDVLRSISSSSTADSTANAAARSTAGNRPGRLETRHPDDSEGSNTGTSAMAQQGSRRGSADTDRDRRGDPTVRSPRSMYSGHGRAAAEPGGSVQRGSITQPRADPRERVDARGSQQAKTPTHGQRQGQGNDRGSWWPLAGWRWGGGGTPGGAADADVKGRSADGEPAFGRFARTFSEPVTVTQQRNRIKTPPNSLPHGIGGADYLHQQAGAGGGGGGGAFSRGGRTGAGAGWAQQRGTPSRPPLTPPSPAHGSSLYRTSGGTGRGGANPIPIRQDVSRRGSRSGSGFVGSAGSGHGYDDREARQGRTPWSPSDAAEGGGGGGYRHTSSQWPRYGEYGHGGSPGVRQDGGGDSDVDLAPVQPYERQRARSHAPSSAPEVSYMGYAAHAREQEPARESQRRPYTDGSGEAAFSLAEDGDHGRLHARHPSYDLGAAISRGPPGQGVGAPWMSPRDGGGLLAPDGSPHSYRKHPSFSPAGGGGRATAVEGSPRMSQHESASARGHSGSNQLTVPSTTPSAATVSSFQALSSSPPESYPLQLAAVIGAQRQRMWGVGGGALATPNAVVQTSTGAFAYTAGGGEMAAAAVMSTAGGVGGGLDRALRARFEQEAVAALEQQQRQQQMTKGRADSNDGSGGSDDFVMVDGSATSADPLGGAQQSGLAQHQQQQHFQRLGGPTGGRGPVGGGEATDPRALGPRLVAAGGRWVWGGPGGNAQTGAAGGFQSGLGVARGGGGEAMGAGDGRGAAVGGGGPPPLSLEGVVRCLQIVELFGRRAVLLAQLGDSRVVPAMHARQNESNEARMRSSKGVFGGPDGTPGTDSLRGLQFATQRGPFAQAREGHGDAFPQGETKPPLFADQEDTTWYSSLLRAPAADLAFGGGSSHGSSSSAGRASTGGAGGGSTCCDSHRLFGEALVLYLKSLSMAKEAIVWGNQALESLAVSRNSTSQNHHPPIPSTPPPSPNIHPTPPVGGPTVARPLDEVYRGAHGQRLSGSSRVNFAEDLENISSRANPSSRPGSGRVGGMRSAGDSAGSSPAIGEAGGLVSSAAPSASQQGSLSSESQVATWGASLLGWLTGQFSTVLRRAERCRVELRGFAQEEKASGSTFNSANGGVSGDSRRGDHAADTTQGRSGVSVSPEESRATEVGSSSTGVFSSSPPGAGNKGVGAETTVPPTGGTSMLSSSSKHGAAPGAVAVSAKDIVVRAALAQAQESAASEVLGMWESARKGYEKAALLLETLLLDALVARPESGGSLTRSNAISRSGTIASPRRGWMASGGESAICTGGSGGGVLSEADQRILQNYMTKFARRAAEVASIEKEELRVSSMARNPPTIMVTKTVTVDSAVKSGVESNSAAGMKADVPVVPRAETGAVGDDAPGELAEQAEVENRLRESEKKLATLSV